MPHPLCAVCFRQPRAIGAKCQDCAVGHDIKPARNGTTKPPATMLTSCQRLADLQALLDNLDELEPSEAMTLLKRLEATP